MAQDSESTFRGASEPAPAQSASTVTLRTVQANRIFRAEGEEVTRSGSEMSATKAEAVEKAAKRSNVPVERV